MKKSIFFAAVFILTLTATVFAGDDDIMVIVGNKEAVFEDQKPIIYEGRVLVPVRGVFELLVQSDNKAENFVVSWDEKTSTVTIKNKWYTVTAKAGDSTFTANGKTIKPDVAPQIINGRFMLPLRAISEAVDTTVEWDEDKRVVKIYYEILVGIEKVD